MTDPLDPPWETLFVDATLATMDGGLGVITDGAIALAGGRIAWLGPRADLPGPPGDLAPRVQALGGLWITPGLIDPRTHLIHGLPAGRTGALPPAVAATRATADEDLQDQAAARLASLLREGVTTVGVLAGKGLEEEAELRVLRVARGLSMVFPISIQVALAVDERLPEDGAAWIARIADGLIPTVGDLADGIWIAPGVDADARARLSEAADRAGLAIWRDDGDVPVLLAGRLLDGTDHAMAPVAMAIATGYCPDRRPMLSPLAGLALARRRLGLSDRPSPARPVGRGPAGGRDLARGRLSRPGPGSRTAAPRPARGPGVVGHRPSGATVRDPWPQPQRGRDPRGPAGGARPAPARPVIGSGAGRRGVLPWREPVMKPSLEGGEPVDYSV